MSGVNLVISTLDEFKDLISWSRANGVKYLKWEGLEVHLAPPVEPDFDTKRMSPEEIEDILYHSVKS